MPANGIKSHHHTIDITMYNKICIYSKTRNQEEVLEFEYINTTGHE